MTDPVPPDAPHASDPARPHGTAGTAGAAAAPWPAFRRAGIDVLEALATTRAIRRVLPDPIPDEDLATIMFTATRAPTGSNRQPFRMIVLRDGERARQAKLLIGEAARRAWAGKRSHDLYDEGSGRIEDAPKARMARTMQRFVDCFEQAPVVVLACLQRYRNVHPYEGGSVYPACQNLLVAARSLGYGGVLTMWHHAVEPELRALLEIPDSVAISATIPLGRPEGRHGPVRRRPVQELIYDDGWGVPAPWASEPEGTQHTQAGPPSKALDIHPHGAAAPKR